MFQKSKETFGEAIVYAFGVILVFIGFAGVLPGVPNYPGTPFAKFIVFWIGCVFIGLGFGMIWFSAWLQARRQTPSKEKMVDPTPLEGGTYRKAPRPRLGK